MSKRNIVHIDESKCDGCGQCVTACAEGAIEIIDGKAKLISEVYCDGLGACLGTCPQDAITIETREAADFDEAAVEARLGATKSKNGDQAHPTEKPFVCPGAMTRSFDAICKAAGKNDDESAPSALGNWPVQLQLVPPTAPYLKGADLLLSAHCAPFAFADLHKRYLPGKVALIACPKLDDIAVHLEKLIEIMESARPASLTILRMEVPCCGGLAMIAEEAVKRAGLSIPITVVNVGIQGEILSETSSGEDQTKSDKEGSCHFSIGA